MLLPKYISVVFCTSSRCEGLKAFVGATAFDPPILVVDEAFSILNMPLATWMALV